MKKLILSIPLLFFLLNGCGILIPLTYNKDKLTKLDLLMSKNDVRIRIGEPDEIRGSITNVDGDIVTVWQYDLYPKSVALINFAFGIPLFTLTWLLPPLKAPDTYWMYFVGDKLAQWGRAGDWRPDVIMQIRLKQE